MEEFQPYLKYILYIVAIMGALWVNKLFITDPILRKWLMQSFEEVNPVTGESKASGKAFSAFVCTLAIIIGWFVAIHTSVNHIAPEYYFVGIISYAGALYGIKEMGRVWSTKYSAPYANGNSSKDKDKKEKIETSKEPEI